MLCIGLLWPCPAYPRCPVPLRALINYFITLVDDLGPLGYAAFAVIYFLLEVRKRTVAAVRELRACCVVQLRYGSSALSTLRATFVACRPGRSNSLQHKARCTSHLPSPNVLALKVLAFLALPITMAAGRWAWTTHRLSD